MQWNLSDSIRIVVFDNSLKSLQRIGLLRLLPRKVAPAAVPGAAKFFCYTIASDRTTPEDWAQSLACKSIIRSCLSLAYQFLLPVKDKMMLLEYLGGIAFASMFPSSDYHYPYC